MKPFHRITLSLALLAAASQSAAQSRIADLIEDGRRFEAIRLIDEGADVNTEQADGTTALHWAVYRKDAALAERLLNHGADASAMNRFGSTPLAEAIKTADVRLVELLLDAGADANAVNVDGQTPLMLAARTGSVPVAEQLVNHNADVNAVETWRGQTALMWAAADNYPGVVEYLIDAGADVSTRAVVNDWGSQVTSEPRAQYRPTGGLTALLYAARSGCLDCIRAIVAAGEPIDRPTPDGVTPLMLAIDNLEFDAAGLLLDLGANPHYSDWWGRTALYIAIDMNTDIPGVPNAGSRPDGEQGTTALELARRLIDAGVEINPQLNMHRVGRGGNSQRFTDDLLTTGATPLIRAALTHDHESLRLLLENGALVDLPNIMGATALMGAASMGVRDVDFGTNRSPSFATDTEIEDKVIESLGILLEAGADIDARITDTESRSARIARPSGLTDRTGQTALFRVAEQGWVRVTEYMLENGADASITDALGRTALDAALGRLRSGAPVFENVAALLEVSLEP